MSQNRIERLAAAQVVVSGEEPAQEVKVSPGERIQREAEEILDRVGAKAPYLELAMDVRRSRIAIAGNQFGFYEAEEFVYPEVDVVEFIPSDSLSRNPSQTNLLETDFPVFKARHRSVIASYEPRALEELKVRILPFPLLRKGTFFTREGQEKTKTRVILPNSLDKLTSFSEGNEYARELLGRALAFARKHRHKEIQFSADFSGVPDMSQLAGWTSIKDDNIQRRITSNPQGVRIYSRRLAEAPFFRTVESDYDKIRSLVPFILQRNSNRVPTEAVRQFIENLDRAFDEWNSSKETLKGNANAAFLIHPRNVPGIGVATSRGEYPDFRDNRYLNDAGRVEPLLRYASDQQIEMVWPLYPPRRIGTISGTTQNGVNMNCALIAVPITPIRIYGQRREGKRDGPENAREKADQAVEFSTRLGAEVIMLGETLASISRHGMTFQEKYKDRKIVTGHRFTAEYMRRWTKEAARLRGRPLQDTIVMINGANGSIGTSIRDSIIEEGIKGLILHDLPAFGNKLNKTAEELMQKYSYLRGKIIVTAGNDQLDFACSQADLILTATSTHQPILHPGIIRSETDIIDDGQPPNASPQKSFRQMYQSSDKPKDVRVYWVLGSYPTDQNGNPLFVNSFDYGLFNPYNAEELKQGQAEFTCALEGIAALGYPELELQTVGRVDVNGVKQARHAIDRIGFGLATPQNYGQPTTSY